MNRITHAIAQVCAALAIAAAGAAARAEQLPVDWGEINFLPAEYAVTLDPTAAFQGNYGGSVRRITPVTNTDEFGGFIQAARAEPWRGKRILMRGWIKTEGATSGNMWLRIDAARRSLALDNMDKRPVKGTTGWAPYEIVLDVPLTAKYLVYGVLLIGDGRVDFDSVEFMVAPAGTETTPHYGPLQLRPPPGTEYTPPSPVLDVPSNLGFESLPK
jgi:hypothetical protein